MGVNPSLIALLLSAALTASIYAYAAWFATLILRGWRLSSGSERQLRLERTTYLVSMLMSYACAFELGSLFLLIYTAEDLHTLFVGAMCAVGTLGVNAYGYPALMLKALNFLLAGLWLIMNSVDNSAPDYPLIRRKYALLLVMAPLAFAETWLLWAYVLGLDPDVITSCCGSLFSSAPSAPGSDLATLPMGGTLAALYGMIAAVVGSALWIWISGAGGGRIGRLPGALLGLSSGAGVVVSVVAVIACVSPYIYELPTHKCPFCLIQADYDYVGYLLYGLILGGGLAGMGAGVLSWMGGPASLASVLPDAIRRLAVASAVSYLAFGALAGWLIHSSGLRLGG